MMENTDLALCAAKKAGSSTYSFFAPSMDGRALERRALQIDLGRMLALR